MKRLLFVVIVLSAVAPWARAQFRYGLRLGCDIATPHASQGIDVKGGVGFAGGLTCEWQSLKSGFAAGLSVIYDHRPVTFTPQGADYRCTPGKDYISVPVDFKYKFWLASVSGMAAPFVVTGPDFAVRMGAGAGHRLHTGWNIGAGFDVVNFLQLSAGYRVGLGKAAPGVSDNGVFVNFTMLFDI